MGQSAKLERQSLHTHTNAGLQLSWRPRTKKHKASLLSLPSLLPSGESNILLAIHSDAGVISFFCKFPPSLPLGRLLD